MHSLFDVLSSAAHLRPWPTNLARISSQQFGDGPCSSNQLDWLRCQLNSSRVSRKGSTSAEDRRDHAKEVWKKRKGEGGAR